MTYPLVTRNAHIYEAIDDERARQERLKAEGKFTFTCADPQMTDGARIAVLGEEFGEVCRAALERGVDGEQSYDKHGKDLRKELIQLCAVGVAMIEALDRRERDAEDKQA